MKRGFKTIKPIGGVRDPRHGTLGGYSYWGCRCEQCMEANRLAGIAMREEKRKHLTPADHRTTLGYSCGCRCDDCMEAEQARRAKNRARKPKVRTKKVKLTNLA